MPAIRPEYKFNSYIRAYEGGPAIVGHSEAVELVERFRTMENLYRKADGALRWISSDAVVPADIMELWHHAGVVTAEELETCKRIRTKEDAASIARYRRRQRNRKPSGEELYEMRAAFGEGATVVDVFSGRRTKL